MAVATREQNWMIYSLPKKRAPKLETNLKCLQDCVHSELARLRESCCEPLAVFAATNRA